MRALVVGAGHMGTLHRRVLGDLGLDVTTVDPDPTKGADYRSAPNRSYHVVCIATPIRHLAQEAAQWAGHQGWLLIEKPGAPSLDDVLELADVLRGQRVAVGYVERFNPQVRALERSLHTAHPTSVRFRRWNDRPSPDVNLDLQSHDIDLASYLGLTCPTVFDTRAGESHRIREVSVCARYPFVVDLMGHDTSPLHAQWHSFLSGRAGPATLTDATAVLTALAPSQLGVAA